jgi:hypothetical protein
MMTGPNPQCCDSRSGPDPLLMLLDGVRHLAWWLMAGLVVSGSWWFTGYRGCAADWLRAGPPRRGTPQRDPIAREAVKGIAALEAYLDSFAPGPGQIK